MQKPKRNFSSHTRQNSTFFHAQIHALVDFLLDSIREGTVEEKTHEGMNSSNFIRPIKLVFKTEITITTTVGRTALKRLTVGFVSK